MILEIVGTGLKVTLSESEAPVPPGCVWRFLCVCAQGGLVDNIEQGVQEAQDYVERAKDFIPKCKKFKKTGKRVRRNGNTISAQLTLSCFSPFSSSSSPPLLPITHPPPLSLNSS